MRTGAIPQVLLRRIKNNHQSPIAVQQTGKEIGKPLRVDSRQSICIQALLRPDQRGGDRGLCICISEGERGL